MFPRSGSQAGGGTLTWDLRHHGRGQKKDGKNLECILKLLFGHDIFYVSHILLTKSKVNEVRTTQFPQEEEASHTAMNGMYDEIFKNNCMITVSYLLGLEFLGSRILEQFPFGLSKA